MKHVSVTLGWICLVVAAGCVTMAPGAGSVRLTRNPPDVADCSPVGNVEVPTNDQGLVDIANAETQFRNQVIGHGGNTGLVTEGMLDVPSAGIAYRCPSGKSDAKSGSPSAPAS
jgi:hypothetical protein